MARLLLACLMVIGSQGADAGEATSKRFAFSGTEMAVPIEIVLYAADEAAATRGAQAALARHRHLNAVLSDYDPESELSRLSRTSGGGKALPVSEDLWNVLCRAQEISEKSAGAFDITVGPVIRLWRRARRREELPLAPQLQAARQLVDYRLIRLSPSLRRVELLKPGMRLDAGGIAKGYALGQAMAVLKKEGFPVAMIQAGGDIALGDPPPGRPGWRIGIAPLEPDGPPSQYLWLSRTAVATSGDIWQYVEIGGRRYSHIIDPRTGQALTDHSMVVVVVPESTLADGLATAVSVLGPDQGLALIEATPGAAALILRAPQGKVERFESCGWKKLPQAQ